MPQSEVPRAVRSLIGQLRIVYAELAASQPQPSDVYSPSGAAKFQDFGRRYAAELYLCAQKLRDEQATVGSGTTEAYELQSELQRILWAVCIWELCVIVFVGRPALLTDVLVPWWQLHLCDRRATEQDLPVLESSDRPEEHAAFWPTLRELVARGLPELALRLLKRHSTLRAGGALSDDEQMLLERLETLLELMPRLAEPELVQVPTLGPGM